MILLSYEFILLSYEIRHDKKVKGGMVMEKDKTPVITATELKSNLGKYLDYVNDDNHNSVFSGYIPPGYIRQSFCIVQKLSQG